MTGADMPFNAETHLDAVAPTVGLAITDAQRPGVLEFLKVASRMAALVESAGLPDDAFDLAPVFRPGSVEAGDDR
ncbi:MAG: DUF4089 domain-containing protein [Beijerinckiaceae bacterium]|nr:DUF4089 domain-containing protein [Beijerinckiaceae bacterium]